jgi:predicted RNA-binding Zn ribbon-like protein
MKRDQRQARTPSKPREAETHRLIGGDPCLDFANTLNGHDGLPAHEYLHDCRDLILWSRHAGVLTAGQAQSLLREASTRPAAAARIYRRALALREVIYGICSALAAGGRPGDRDLDRLNTAWQDGQRHACVAPSSAGLALGWDDDPALERMLRILCDAAVHLLTSGKVGRIRKCAGDDCDWLFLDSSRNHLRRWCAMDMCGNRIKMRRRHYRQILNRI